MLSWLMEMYYLNYKLNDPYSRSHTETIYNYCYYHRVQSKSNEKFGLDRALYVIHLTFDCLNGNAVL